MATRHADAPADGGLALSAAQQAVLADEVEAFARTLRDPDARQRYLQLAAAARQGVVPPDLAGLLAAMLELVLQTQRVRRTHGPEAEQALAELFYRTPRGAGLRQAAGEVNRALEALRGQRLEQVSVVVAPGRHTLVLVTERCRLTLRLDGAGARIEDVEVGG